MKELRKVTYARDDILDRPLDRPYVFYAPNLCGSYAIFIFGSYRCDKYLRGLCTPCHYSGLLHPASAPRSEVFASILDQTDYLLAHFDELVFAHQDGRGAGYRLNRPHEGGRFADLQIAGEGSFLRDGEVPPEIRREVLRRLVEFSRRERINLHVGLEVKAEDVVHAEARGELESWGRWVEELNLTLIMGFESIDPFVRNVIFNKDLSLESIERAISIGHARGMRPTCFVYPGNHGMTDAEAVADAVASVRWLRSRDAGIYMMLPNLQPHTIPHVLYHAGAYNLIDVRTAVGILDELLAGSQGESPVHYHAGDDWNIGGVTSEPDPEINVFTNERAASCAACRGAFRAAVWHLAQRHDVVGYRERVSAIEACACRERHVESARSDERRSARPIAERVEEDLERVAAEIPGYRPGRTVLKSGAGAG